MSIWTGPFITLWVVLSICLLVSIAVYVAFKIRVDSEIENASELCGKDFKNIDFFEDAPKQRMEIYAWNLSNPTEYLNGGEARLHEKGPYPFDLKVTREFLEFPGGGKFMNYTQLNQLNFAEKDNCKGCGHAFTEQITVLNPVYLAILAKATSEATMFMSASCSTTQLGLLKQNPAAPYCRKTDLKTATTCRCCVPPIDGFDSYGLNDTEYDDNTYAFCDELASPQGAQAGLFSWLGMYDGAHKLDSLPSAFVLSSGTYTNLLRTFSVSEMLTGSMSALAGTINFLAAAPLKDTDDESLELYEGILDATQDMKDVCYNVNFTFCPQLEDVMATLSTIVGPNGPATIGLRVNYIKSIRCSGTIPAYEELISEGGLNETRALELRYLEGLPCNNFAASIAFAALLQTVPGSSGTCADGGPTPCCLASFSLQGGASTGGGVGCLRFINGLLQNKRVYSGEEARDVVGTTVKQKTVCNSDNKLQLFEYFGRSQFKEWFTPASYSYGAPGAAGVMPWADPVIVNNAGTAVPGSFSEVRVSDARAVNQIVPGEIGRSFLAPDLNNGDPNDEDFTIYATMFLRNLPAKFVENEDKFGLQSARFELKKLYGRDDSADEASDTSGQLPYPNMYNLIYSEEGRPAILTRPNFLDVNAAIYAQDNNAKRFFANGQAGVKLYRTRAKYSAGASEIEPELITADYVDSHRGAFESSWNYEPTSGLTITNTITTQFSMFTMNCNPYIDSFCSVRAEAGNDMCYTRLDSDNSPYSVPCSFANVHTPNVHGEKVFPFYWNTVTTKPPQDVIDQVLRILDVRFAFSILIVIFAVLLFILIIYTAVAWRNDCANAPAPVATDEQDADAKKPADPEGEIAMTGVITQGKQENI